MSKRKPTRHTKPRPPARRRAVFTGGLEWLGLFAAGLLVCANLFIFAPFEIIRSNPAEFDVTFGELLPLLIGTCVILAWALTGLGLLLPKRLRSGATAVLLALGLLLWIQGSFLRWGYGVFDGSGIDWSGYLWQGWVDTGIWIVVLALAVRFRDRIAPHAAFVAAGFILIQAVLVAADAARGPDGDASPGLARADEVAPKSVPRELCQLSHTRNVFHFIMDSYQSDIFMELVAEESLAEKFDGFTVFPDNMSTGSRTVISVPSAFSTEVYGNNGGETESEYFRRAAGESFHYLLHTRGYLLNLMPHVSMKRAPGDNYFKRPATYAAPERTRRLRSAVYLVDVSLFRELPHYLKRVVFNDQNWLLSSLSGDPPSHLSFHQKAFFRDYTNRLEVVHTKPAYHFVHLMPPHGPYVTLPDGSYAGEALANTRENYKNEARHITRMFVDFLERLKNLDLYDSSLILLHGDHGAGFNLAGNSPAQRRISWMDALMLVKPARARGPLKVSLAQTSLTDIPATVLEELGIEHTFPGDSMLELDPGAQRVRSVAQVPDESAKEPIVHRWVVEGTSRDSTSWRELDPIKVVRRTRHYEWGTRLGFGVANLGDVYLTEGWSTTSPTYTWNDGHKATITFGIDKPSRNIMVRLVYFAWVAPGKVDSQRIHITANGLPFPELVCTDRTVQVTRAIIPWEVLQTDSMVFSFEFPDAVVPKSIGEGNESRQLAMGLYQFEATLAPDSVLQRSSAAEAP